jgi:CubicO group peptidase (beta-lactamase class C family)
MIVAKTPYRPDEVEYDESRLGAVNRHLQRLIDEKQLFGAAYCLSRDGKVFANAALGRLSYKAEDPREFLPDSPMRVASITKLFCAAALFRLVEDGIIRLNQCAGEILPEMNGPPFKDITLAQLLSHSSGLNPDPGCFGNELCKSPWEYIEIMKGRNWLEAGLSVGMHAKPGTEWAYSSFGYCILGEAVTRAAGMDVHDFIKKEIFDPCGMADTAFSYRKSADAAERARLKAIYERAVVRDKDTEEEIVEFLEGKERADSPFDAVPETAGGIVSTVLDLIKFGNMLLNQGTTLDGKRVLGRRTVHRMTERYTRPEILDRCWGAGGVERPYALGPDRRRNADNLYSPSYYFHEGAGGCALIIDPDERMVGAWLVPFADGQWKPAAVYSTGAVAWSGLR